MLAPVSRVHTGETINSCAVGLSWGGGTQVQRDAGRKGEVVKQSVLWSSHSEDCKVALGRERF